MINWLNADKRSLELLKSIQILFGKHAYLLTFLLEPDRASLKDEPEELIKQAMGFSHGERVLVQIALDLWCGLGETELLEVFETLDKSNCTNFLLSLQYYAENFVHTPPHRRH